LVLNRDDKVTEESVGRDLFESPPPGTPPMQEKRPLRRQPDDHHFWSLIMLAVTAGGFLLVTWVASKVFFFSSKHLQPLESRILASSGYLELGMFDDAALIFQEIAPEDK
jgi:hypothetical protein